MKLLIVLLVLGVAYAKHEYYTGWKSYNISPENHEQLEALGSVSDTLELDFFINPIIGREGLVIVKPEHQDNFIKTIQGLKIAYRVHSENIAETFRADDEKIEARANQTARNGRSLPYDNYQRLSVINAYLDDVAARYPNLATVVTGGNSFEGRPIKYLKISTTNFEDLSKPVIFIDAGIHAREWVTPPTVTWAIHKLLEDVTEPDLLERFDWILLPVVNPDGYEYSHTDYRLWRKTRSNDSSLLSSFCPGVDGNRNYDFYWNTVGTGSTCSDTYGGSRAFSESETRVVRDILHEHLGRIALYLTMHSFGSMILYSWGHDLSLSNNALGLHVVGVAMAETIDSHALPEADRYQVGNLGHVIGYVSSGGAMDYAHLIGVPLSYTFELPALGFSFIGFIVNPIYIEQICKETWAGIVVGARRAGDLFVN